MRHCQGKLHQNVSIILNHHPPKAQGPTQRRFRYCPIVPVHPIRPPAAGPLVGAVHHPNNFIHYTMATSINDALRLGLALHLQQINLRSACALKCTEVLLPGTRSSSHHLIPTHCNAQNPWRSLSFRSGAFLARFRLPTGIGLFHERFPSTSGCR